MSRKQYFFIMFFLVAIFALVTIRHFRAERGLEIVVRNEAEIAEVKAIATENKDILKARAVIFKDIEARFVKIDSTLSVLEKEVSK